MADSLRPPLLGDPAQSGGVQAADGVDLVAGYQHDLRRALGVHALDRLAQRLTLGRGGLGHQIAVQPASAVLVFVFVHSVCSFRFCHRCRALSCAAQQFLAHCLEHGAHHVAAVVVARLARRLAAQLLSGSGGLLVFDGRDRSDVLLGVHLVGERAAAGDGDAESGLAHLLLLLADVRGDAFLVLAHQREGLVQTGFAQELAVHHHRHAGQIAAAVADHGVRARQSDHLVGPEQLVLELDAALRDLALGHVVAGHAQHLPAGLLHAGAGQGVVKVDRLAPAVAFVGPVVVGGEGVVPKPFVELVHRPQLPMLQLVPQLAGEVLRPFLRASTTPAWRVADVDVLQRAEESLHGLGPAVIGLRVVDRHVEQLDHAVAGDVAVQIAQVVFLDQAGLEGLAAVVLAVVYVEMGGQAVEGAVFRVGHAADERLGDRLRVRVGAKHPAQPDGLATGSSRSVQGFDIYKAVESARDLLENFGGHPYAVGLSLKEENIPAFTKRFEDYVAANILPSQLRPQLDIDTYINFADITPEFISILRKFNPFGPWNNKPVFCARGVIDFGTSKLVGRNLEHIKLELVDNTCGKVFNGIAFNMSQYFDYIHSQKPFDICFTIEENKHHGATSTIQLLVKEIHVGK